MPDATEPILLKNVWKLYGKTTALAGLSLAVPPGTIFGFLGPNGAGKSTAIRILLGLQQPSRGTVSLFGRQFPEGRGQARLAFLAPIPWGMILRNCTQVFGLAFAGLTIQNWISLRSQSFSVAMAAGIVLLHGPQRGKC